MSKKHQQVELDKTERIKKHARGHKSTHGVRNTLSRIEPRHKPSKKSHTNFLHEYEQHGEDLDYEDYNG